MTDYTKLQSRCQRGEATLAGANNLLAECYGALGKLMAENETLALKHAEAGRLYLELAAERDQLLADKAALLAAYNAAGEREHELRVDRSALREAVKFAVKTFKTITSSDGSGHADLAVAILRIAGSAMGEGEQP